MAINLVGRTSDADALKASLDVSAQRTRLIADRVARATAERQGFTLPGAAAGAGADVQGPIDLEAEMVSLADETLRFEATAKLLQQTYAELRESLKDK
ncbi:MAG: hypothetical protein HYX65_03625 [Gemmatimonadetes bacterium]|nr:hypothetical protein [Gemmatimonadota bacterium]